MSTHQQVNHDPSRATEAKPARPKETEAAPAVEAFFDVLARLTAREHLRRCSEASERRGFGGPGLQRPASIVWCVLHSNRSAPAVHIDVIKHSDVELFFHIWPWCNGDLYGSP